MNPLELPGPQFLIFFLVLLLGATILAAAARAWIRMSSGGPISRGQLSVIELAMVAGGRKRAMHTAIISLAEQRKLHLLGRGRVRHASDIDPPKDPFEQKVMDLVFMEHSTRISDLMARCRPHLEKMENRLIAGGYLVSHETSRFAQTTSALIVGVALAIGVAKIFVGLSRERPVGVLVLLCIAAAAIMLWFLLARMHSTHSGSAKIDELQSVRDPKGVVRLDPAASLALFGPAVLADTVYAQHIRDMREPRQTHSSGNGSGCSSSSCNSGGDSSCGGGGSSCGGGGCGGCGGGS